MENEKREVPMSARGMTGAGSDVHVCEGEWIRFCPTSPVYKQAFKEYQPRDIDEVSELLGPRLGTDARKDPCACLDPRLRTRLLNPEDFADKDASVRGAAHELAYLASQAYVNGAKASLVHWRPVLNHWLGLVKSRIVVGLLKDITVASGGTFTVSRLVHAVYANKVRLYGTGRILCQGPTTIRSESFEGKL